MATLEELDAAPAITDVTDAAAATVAQAATVAAEAASAGGELDPELDSDFHVDPAYTSSKQFEESAKKEKRRDGIQTLKSAVIISGVVVAVIGAIIVVSKKIKEAR